jgi:hypothetical protein
MTGEIAIGGVFVPTLLLLAAAAFMLTTLAIRLLGVLGLYRFVAYRALVDVCLFIFILAALALLFPLLGVHQ